MGRVEEVGGDGAGEQGDGTSVYVFTEGGEMLEADEYALDVAKARSAAAEHVEIKKASQQQGPNQRVIRWSEPRVSPEDLLYFLDVNVWHRRCVLVKSLLVGGLGWQLLRGNEVVYDPLKSEALPDDPVARLLAGPNPDRMQPLDVLIGRFLTDYYALGNAYLEVVRDRAGRIAELYHVPGRTMRRPRPSPNRTFRP